ncbi:MAG: hypothetical protein U0694_04415 [Anaerolineae bacterium]
MPRFYLRLSLLCVLLFTLLGVMMSAAGQHAADTSGAAWLRSRLRGRAAAVLVWRIVPGVTTMDEARNIALFSFQYIESFNLWTSHSATNICDVQIYNDEIGHVAVLGSGDLMK